MDLTQKQPFLLAQNSSIWLHETFSNYFDTILNINPDCGLQDFRTDTPNDTIVPQTSPYLIKDLVKKSKKHKAAHASAPQMTRLPDETRQHMCRSQAMNPFTPCCEAVHTKLRNRPHGAVHGLAASSPHIPPGRRIT